MEGLKGEKAVARFVVILQSQKIREITKNYKNKNKQAKIPVPTDMS